MKAIFVWGAHAASVLVSASRRTNFQTVAAESRSSRKVRDARVHRRHAASVRSPDHRDHALLNADAATTLQERIDAAAPGETIRVEAGVQPVRS